MYETTCIHCGCVLGEEVFFFQDETFCEDCFRELTVLCHHCGDRICRHDNAGDTDTILCRQCCSTYYIHCDHSGRLIYEEDAYYESDDDSTPCCYHCHNANQSIHGYYYKPEPIFYGSVPRYFGVELEVDDAGEDYQNGRTVLEEANAMDAHIYCKHDGSLIEGFVLVIYPMSLEYHLHHMPWEKVLSCLKYMGYRSHDTDTCSLHCHISRDALGETLEE